MRKKKKKNDSSEGRGNGRELERSHEESACANKKVGGKPGPRVDCVLRKLSTQPTAPARKSTDHTGRLTHTVGADGHMSAHARLTAGVLAGYRKNNALEGWEGVGGEGPPFSPPACKQSAPN